LHRKEKLYPMKCRLTSEEAIKEEVRVMQQLSNVWTGRKTAAEHEGANEGEMRRVIELEALLRLMLGRMGKELQKAAAAVEPGNASHHKKTNALALAQ
ncbi:MAG: hypothetical protein SGPRY_015041, partial [Prymnesium sp.]